MFRSALKEIVVPMKITAQSKYKKRNKTVILP